jgi:ribonucleoside-triphosphate reductase
VRRPTHVRKRDGRIVPFDEGKIADAIYRAALAVGGEDRFLAEELASMVTLFLGKTLAVPDAGMPGPALPGMDGVAGDDGTASGPGDRGAVPTIEQIQDMVEKVLVETGHARTAKAYILHRERRSRLREAAAARLEDFQPSLFDDRFLLVEDPAAERAAPFSVDRLARTVAAEAGLEREAARAVAEAVEGRLHRAKVRRIPAPVLSSLVDAELLEGGLLPEPRRRSGAVVSRAVIDEALAPKGRFGAAVAPETAARRLGGEVLRAHALAEVFPAEVSSAHLDGTLHVHGLARPAALFTLTLSLDALKVEGVPGGGGRVPARAADGARRFIAQVGRAVRTLRSYGTHGLGVPAANLLLAPMLAGCAEDEPDPGDLREEAWHLLAETAGDPDGVPVELDLLAETPPALARAPALGQGGRRDGTTLGAHAARALALARAIVAARESAEGLPPRPLLPALNLVAGRASLGDPRCRELLREALGAAVRGAPVRLVLERDGGPVAGTALCREHVEKPERFAGGAPLRPFCAQRVTINLPRAAFRVPPGDLAGFFRECDRAVELAVEAHRARRSLFATLAAGEGGALAPLFRRPRTAGAASPGPSDLAAGSWSVGVTGLNEALAHLLGEELHEGDGAVKVGCRVLAYLALRVREAGKEADLAAFLDASPSLRAAERFYALDRREHRAEQDDAAGARGAYTPGVAVRPGAPVDFLGRLEAEGRLHGHLRTAVFRFDPAGQPGVSEEGLLVLLEKAFLHTAVSQMEIGG